MRIVNGLKVKLKKIFVNPSDLFVYLGTKGYLNWLPDEKYLKVIYFSYLKEPLNLKNPKRFSEKLQWLKIQDKNKELTKFVDKYEVRKIIAEKLGEEYLIPMIGQYSSVDDINWEALPSKFVLKATHGCGSNIICKDKSKLDTDFAVKKLNGWMNKNWYWYGREWSYKNIKPRIICEEFMEEKNDAALTDYKFYCFSGEVKYCQVIRDRGQNETIDFYDIEWNNLPFNGLRNLPRTTKKYKKPEKYEEMIRLAQILCKEFIFVRMDFYLIKNNIYFGEYTFYPTSGFGKFYPDEWNQIIGDMVHLDENK